MSTKTTRLRKSTTVQRGSVPKRPTKVDIKVAATTGNVANVQPTLVDVADAGRSGARQNKRTVSVENDGQEVDSAQQSTSAKRRKTSDISTEEEEQSEYSSTEASSTGSTSSEDYTTRSTSKGSKQRGKKRSIEHTIDKRLEVVTEELKAKIKRKEKSFKYNANQEQFEFNDTLIADLREASRKSKKKVQKKIKRVVKKLKKRNKLIRMADRSNAGWKLVEQYQMHEVASDEEDDNKIKKAEKRALALIAEEREKRQRLPKKETYSKTTDRERFRNAPRGQGKSKENDMCFRCGRKGHWQGDFYAYKRQDNYGRRDGH